MTTTQPKTATELVPVTVDNFVRAESDLYFGNLIRHGSLGKFFHERVPADVDNQNVIRLNRDTLYSSSVFDLDAGPVTVHLPDAGKRFRSMQIVNEDQYTDSVNYDAGAYFLTGENIGTRYVLVIIRTLVEPADSADVEQVHALQDAITVEQASVGRFEVPNWDLEGQKKVRDALLVLGAALPDSRNMFGSKDQVDPIRFLIGAAMAWGGNPEREAKYVNVTPAKNDGKTIHTLTVKGDVRWTASGRSASTTPRAISRRTRPTHIRSTT